MEGSGSGVEATLYWSSSGTGIIAYTQRAGRKREAPERQRMGEVNVTRDGSTALRTAQLGQLEGY